MTHYGERSSGAVPNDRHSDISVCILEEPAGKVLLLRRSNAAWKNGVWELPTWRVNWQFSPLETALHLAEVNSGIVLSKTQVMLCAERTIIEGNNPTAVVYHLYTANLDLKPDVVPRDPYDRAGWYHPREALQLELFGQTPILLRIAYDL